MKSIVEEASSIAKAIEKGWEKAGKPQEFKIKIFEQAEKNFLGFTKKPAKIALFFHEEGIKDTNRGHTRSSQRPDRERRPAPSYFKRQDGARPSYPEQDYEGTGSGWTSDMTTTLETLVKNSLELLELPNITFAMEAQGRIMRVVFSTPLIENKKNEKILFSSYSHLLMEALRNKFKHQMRDLRINFQIA